MRTRTTIDQTYVDIYFFKEAAREAVKALCLRDKCGAVIVSDGRIIGRGYNGPPNNSIGNRKCNGKFTGSLKPKSDRTCCVHAEWRVIIDAISSGGSITNSTLYFTRVDSEENILRSKQPYCTVCSRLALDVGIKYFALWHDKGIKTYTTREYNDLSYVFHQEKT